MNLLDLGLFAAGVILGIHLEQTYELPNIKNIYRKTIYFLQQYEPKKKGENNDTMDLD